VVKNLSVAPGKLGQMWADSELKSETMVTMNERAPQSVQEMNRQALNVTIEYFTNITVEAVASLPSGKKLKPLNSHLGLFGWHQHVLFPVLIYLSVRWHLIDIVLQSSIGHTRDMKCFSLDHW